jgi:hypothetical protein
MLTFQRRRRPSAQARKFTGDLVFQRRDCCQHTTDRYAVWLARCCYPMAGAWDTSWYVLGWPGSIGSMRHMTQPSPSLKPRPDRQRGLRADAPGTALAVAQGVPRADRDAAPVASTAPSTSGRSLGIRK